MKEQEIAEILLKENEEYKKLREEHKSLEGALAEIDKKVYPDEDSIMGMVLDAGAQDMQTEEDVYAVTTDARDLEVVKKALENNKIKTKSAEITMIPSTVIKLEGDTAKQVLGLVEALEEHDDVQNVYANFDIADEIIEKLS